jgi:hypothetical protein
MQKAVERITAPGDLSGLCRIGQNIQFLKSRLWGGLVPVPASRWREKDLNNPDHFTIAHEYMTSIIAVFEYLNNPLIRNTMRDTFNKISGDLGEVQDDLIARRKAEGSLSPDLNLTGHWEQFIRARYEVMTSTAHSWVLARVPSYVNEHWTASVRSQLKIQKAQKWKFFRSGGVTFFPSPQWQISIFGCPWMGTTATIRPRRSLLGYTTLT